MPEFYMIFARKMPRILHGNRRKIFSRMWGKGRACVPSAPVSYAYMFSRANVSVVLVTWINDSSTSPACRQEVVGGRVTYERPI